MDWIETPWIAAWSRLIFTSTDGLVKSMSLVTSAKPVVCDNWAVELGRGFLQLNHVGGLQHILIERLGSAAAHPDHGRILHIGIDAHHAGEFRPQLLDDLIGAEAALVRAA